MSYTNAIFFMDYELGSDTARAGFAGVASNPSGTTVNIHAVGHGLVTGAVVDLTAFTAWLNAAFKITVTGLDDFTLDNTVWQAAADPNGTVTPRGGMNWTDAWKTMTTGATAARLAAGDTIKIAKSPNPVSVGNAAWTYLDKTVTLETAQNLTITDCEADWTAVNATSSAKLAVATDAKEGSFCLKLVEDATPGANQMQAYYATGELVLSGYQKISFWIKNEVAITDGSTFIINLYSSVDASGAAVDSFALPAIPSTGRWLPLTIVKTGGGDMGASIKSVAVLNGTTTYTASKYIYLDNIIACTTDGLNLQSLISKNSAVYGGAEPWLGIQSINGATILLDTETNTKANAGKGYSGATAASVTTYKRETIKTILAASASTLVQECKKAGTATSMIAYEGGYNTGDSSQDGETYFDGLNGNGYGVHSAVTYNSINRVSGARYDIGMGNNNGTADNSVFYLKNIQGLNNMTEYGIRSPLYLTVDWLGNACNCGASGIFSLARRVQIEEVGNLSGNVRGINGASSIVRITKVGNIKNNTAGVYINTLGASIYVGGASLADNTADITNGADYSPVDVELNNCSLTSAVELNNTSGNNYNMPIKITNDQNGLSRSLYKQGTASNLATDRVGGTGKMWKIAIADSKACLVDSPIKLKAAVLAVEANKTLNVSAYIKKDNTSTVGARLVVRGAQIAGIPDTIFVEASSADTDWHLTSLAAMLPTATGVIEVEFWGYYVTGNSNVYIEGFVITQA
jgi:hypothetical protein